MAVAVPDLVGVGTVGGAVGWRDVLRGAQEAPVPVDALATALRTSWPDAEVADVALLEGGLGSVLHRVTLTGAPVRSVVLRQLLVEFGDDADVVRREVLVHDALARRGLRVPAVHWSDPSGEVLGRPALVLDDVPGSVLVVDLGAPRAREAFAGALAEVAAAPVTELAPLDVLADVDEHVLRFGEPPDSALVDSTRIAGAVAARAGWFRPRRRLVHADLHAGNVLWDGTTVTGVLDWPGAALGNPLFDEAYAWLDTTLAHGRAVGDALQVALDEHRRGPPPSAGEAALWRACALHRALPTPRPWAEAYRAWGLEVTDDEVEARFVSLVEDELGSP